MAKVAKSLKVEQGYPHRIHRKKRRKYFSSKSDKKIQIQVKQKIEKLKTYEMD